MTKASFGISQIACLLLSVWLPTDSFADDRIQEILERHQANYIQTQENLAEGIWLDLNRGGNYRKKNKDGVYDSIGLTYDNCLEENKLGAEVYCTRDALKSYEDLLEKIYQEALERSDEGTRKALILSQQKWIDFRKAEHIAQENFNRTEKGSIMKVVLPSKEIVSVRERICELIMYVDGVI